MAEGLARPPAERLRELGEKLEAVPTSPVDAIVELLEMVMKREAISSAEKEKAERESQEHAAPREEYRNGRRLRSSKEESDDETLCVEKTNCKSQVACFIQDLTQTVDQECGYLIS